MEPNPSDAYRIMLPFSHPLRFLSWPAPRLSRGIARVALLLSGVAGVLLLAGSQLAVAAPGAGETPETGPAETGDVVVPTSPAPPPTQPSDLPPPPGTAQPPSGSSRFGCQIQQGNYTVMYQPESQPNQAYAWAVPQAMGGGWSPDRRCDEISRRLEFYRPDGLVEMQIGSENGYNTVCVTTEQVPSCRIVFTVPPGQDPVTTRDRVFQNLALADSGETTQGVYTFAERPPSRRPARSSWLGQLGQLLQADLTELMGAEPFPATGSAANRRAAAIQLKPFLDPADGGTGLYLQHSRAVRYP